MKLQQAHPMNEAADRLREWIPTAENAVGETGSVADLDAALATADRLAVQRSDEEWALRVAALEQRAVQRTVERIRERALYDSGFSGEATRALHRILDAITGAESGCEHPLNRRSWREGHGAPHCGKCGTTLSPPFPAHKGCSCVNCESGPFFR